MGSDSLHPPQRSYRLRLLRLLVPLSLLAIGVPYIIYRLIVTPIVLSEEHDLFQRMEQAHPECKHYQLQQTVPQFGQHLLCMREDPGSTGYVYVSMIQNSLVDSETVHLFSTNPGGKKKEIRDFYEYIHEKMGNKELAIEFWRIYEYDSLGNQEQEITNIDQLVEKKSFILYTGGSFMWPGVKVGYRRKMHEGYMMETISLRPLVFKVENFLTEEECDYIKSESEGRLLYHVTQDMISMDTTDNTIVNKHNKKPEYVWRTSTQTFLESRNRPILGAIDERLATLTKTSIELQEPVQIVKFTHDQFYDQHHDYFEPKFYQKDPSFLIQLKDGRNRLATALWYLSTVKTGNGGHTIFSKQLDGKNLKGFHDNNCEIDDSLKIQPRKGDILVFYNLYADRSLDKSTLHGSCPLTGGEAKWTANKWIWTE